MHQALSRSSNRVRLRKDDAYRVYIVDVYTFPNLFFPNELDLI